jgi:hypothetical protein
MPPINAQLSGKVKYHFCGKKIAIAKIINDIKILRK